MKDRLASVLPAAVKDQRRWITPEPLGVALQWGYCAAVAVGGRRHWLAGLLAHAPALDALCAPTIPAYAP